MKGGVISSVHNYLLQQSLESCKIWLQCQRRIRSRSLHRRLGIPSNVSAPHLRTKRTFLILQQRFQITRTRQPKSYVSVKWDKNVYLSDHQNSIAKALCLCQMGQERVSFRSSELDSQSPMSLSNRTRTCIFQIIRTR